MSMELFSPPPFKVVGDALEADVKAGKKATVLDSNGKPAVITGTGSGGGGGLNYNDWSAFTPHFDLSPVTTYVTGYVWKPWLNISGTGVLKWLKVAGMNGIASTPSVRITVDGVPYIINAEMAVESSGGQVTVDIPFNSSLVVESYYSGNLSTYCNYLYWLKTSEPNPTANTFLSQASKKLVRLNTTDYINWVDVLNLTGKSGYILKINYSAYLTMSNGNPAVYRGITIDGTPYLTDSTEWTPSKREAGFNGPIRFNSSVNIRIKNSPTSNSSAYCEVWYTTTS